MKQVLIGSIFVALLSGCAQAPPSFTRAQEMQRPPAQRTPCRLTYGNDPSLERAFNHYARTGRAPNIMTDGFIKFGFNAGQQPIIKTMPFQETVISLEPGERFTNISSGDPSRWVYSVAVSGSGAKLQQHVLVKPSLPDISTNLVITTDRRLYNLRLLSSLNAGSSKNVSFWYPDDMLATIKQVDEGSPASSPDVSLNNLNFNYRISGRFFSPLPTWSPARVFDDGTHTYIQFPQKIANQELPVLFVSDKNTKELVNYRSKPPYFVVDKLFKQAVLIMGVGHSQTSVTLTNNRYF